MPSSPISGQTLKMTKKCVTDLLPQIKALYPDKSVAKTAWIIQDALDVFLSCLNGKNILLKGAHANKVFSDAVAVALAEKDAALKAETTHLNKIFEADVKFRTEQFKGLLKQQREADLNALVKALQKWGMPVRRKGNAILNDDTGEGARFGKAEPIEILRPTLAAH